MSNSIAMSKPVKVTPELIAETLFAADHGDGVFGRTALFEQVIDGLTRLIDRHREAEIEILHFPPVMSRRQLESSGYLQSFPHLLGCVSCLRGSEGEVRALVEGPGWAGKLSPTEFVLSPAACYPLYPLAASRGPLPTAGRLFDVTSYCFRHEATCELDRLQAFRMREFVRMGTPAQILDFRQRWIARAERMAQALALPYTVAAASDPFFGRAGRIAALSQLEQELKFELLVPVHSAEQPTACMSFNYHRDHFGETWKLVTDDNKVAHTGCVAFGMERMVLALFATHGLDLREWPSTTREALTL